MKIIAILILVLFSQNALSVQCFIKRDKHGKIYRSSKAIREFKKSNPCPDSTQTNGRCIGYVIDHIIPLCACGKDSVVNMQWQDIDSAKAKDKIERKTCRELSDIVG